VVSGRAAEVVLYVVTMLLSTTVHEYSHAVAADRLGDDTPRRQGRLTLSPLEHYDVWGTFVIPIVAGLAGGVPFIGWARPVETNPGRYHRGVSMRAGERIVAFAGPLSNLVLAVVSAGLLGLLVREGGRFDLSAGTGDALGTLLAAMVTVNLGLFIFNLLPIPPLDGARLLPRSMDELQQAIAPYSFMILLVIVAIPGFRTAVFWPVAVLGSWLAACFGLTPGIS
jgi:Zn-dependent protease